MAEQKPLTLKGLITERLITKDQEKIYRLHHHNFNGLTIEMAAARMKLFVEEAEELLDQLYSIAPQLFPCLDRTAHKIYMMYANEGYTQKDIATHFKITKSSVQRLIKWMRNQGMPGLNYRTKRPRIQRYERWMDDKTDRNF